MVVDKLALLWFKMKYVNGVKLSYLGGGHADICPHLCFLEDLGDPLSKVGSLEFGPIVGEEWTQGPSKVASHGVHIYLGIAIYIRGWEMRRGGPYCSMVLCFCTGTIKLPS